MCVRKFRLARNTHVLSREQEKAIHAKKKVKGIKKGDLRNKASGKIKLYDVGKRKYLTVKEINSLKPHGKPKVYGNGMMQMMMTPDGRPIPQFLIKSEY
jgi:hypothetical protein